MLGLILHSFIISSWVFLNASIALHLFVYGYPNLMDNEVLYPTVDELFSSIIDKTDIPVPNNWVVSLIIGITVTTILLSICAYYWMSLINKYNQKDILDKAKHSFVWAARNNFGSSFVVVPLLILFLLLTMEWLGNYPTVAGAILVILLIIPVVVLNPAIYKFDKIGSWYKISWPGWQPIAISYGGYALAEIVDITIIEIGFSQLPTLLSTVVYMIWFVFYIYITGVFLSVFLKRTNFSDLSYEIKGRTNIQFIVAWFIFEARMLIIILWFIPPILLASFTSIFIVPQVEAVADTTGTALSGSINLFIDTMHFTQEYSFLLIGIIAIFLLLAAGKFLCSYDALILDSRPSANADSNI